METVKIGFTLTNTSDTDQNVCLIAASVKAGRLLKGRTLTMGSFLATEGDAEIIVTNLPEDAASDLQEFVDHYDIRVDSAKVRSDSMNQALNNFMTAVYPIFKKPVVKDILANAYLLNQHGPDKGKVLHQFDQPFLAKADVSLLMRLNANTSVDVELTMVIPGLTYVAPEPEE